MWGTPSVVVAAGVTTVFTRTKAGDLVEYANDGKVGHRWNGYDLSVIAAGPKLASDPAALYDPTTAQVRVAATELGPHRGDVIVFSPDDVGGRVWSVTDVTQATVDAARLGRPRGRSSTAATRRCSARTRQGTSPSTSGPTGRRAPPGS